MATYQGVDIDLEPTEDMRREARIGLVWRDEYDRGGTEVGVGTARAIISGSELSPDRVRRMYAYFERHAVDREADGWERGEPGFPSAGKIAWLLWGGDPGRRWAGRKRDELMRIDESSSRSYRTAPFKVKAVGNQAMTFEGYASVFDTVDSYGDVVMRGAFKQSIDKATDANQWPSMLWQHDQKQPVGAWREMFEDDHGLYVKGELADTSLGRDVYHLLMMNALNGLSIGYAVKEESYNREAAVRELKAIDLWEVSVVTFPANTDARIHEVKQSGHDARFVEKVLRDAGLSRTNAKAIVARGLAGLRDADAEDLLSNADAERLVKMFRS